MDDVRKTLIEQSPEIEYEAIDQIVSLMDIVDRELPKSMPLKLIKEKANEAIAKAFVSGGHRKLFGKKMREKLNGYISTYHSKLYKTYLIFKLRATKRGIDFDFSTINYTNTKDGMVYIHRHRGAHPDISVFTAHFFDRLMERGYGFNVMSREKAILTFLLDHIEVQKEYGFTVTTASTGETMSYMLHGAAIGKSFWMKANHRYSFLPDNECDPGCTAKVQMRFFLTYYSMDMLTEFQRKLITRGEEIRSSDNIPPSGVTEFVMEEGD